MHKYPEPTPCPVHTTSPRHLGRHATPSYCTDRYKPLRPGALPLCDDTEDTEVTTELRVAARQAQPPRRWSTKGGAGSFVIHEDIARDGALPNMVEPFSSQMVAKALGEKILLLQRPPATLPWRALQASYRSREAGLPLPQHGRCHGSATLAKRQQHTAARSAGSSAVAQTDQQRSAALRKEPRRRTILVPSEDTTILTIHPGLRPEAQARSITDDIPCPESLGLFSVGASTIPPADMVRRVPRNSLATAPKRAPLQPMSKPPQELSDSSDKPGLGVGKENVPPGVRVTRPYIDSSKHPIGSAGSSSTFQAHGSSSGASKPAPSSLSERASLKNRNGLVRNGGRMQPMYIKSQGQSDTLALKRPILGDVAKQTKPYSATNVPIHEKRGTYMTPVADVPSKLITPVLSRPTRHAGHPYLLLPEDISRPEMFEEEWLSDKEAAITQLVNRLFQATDARELCRHSSTKTVRRDLLQLYQEPSTSLLYSRLKASLLYGALSIPSYRIHDCSRVSTDVGLRSKVVSLWTGTYHLPSLRAAAEVVVGREAPSSLKASAGMLPDGDQPRKETRRDLELFLDSCLIRNEDCERPRRLPMNSSAPDQKRSALDHEFGSPKWSLRRTMLRSLMMIHLLDKAKDLGMISGNLFCTSSRFKSSASVLRELFSLLLPSAGDVSRPLMHLHYKVCHVQFPLNEYDYDIKNLATDLRDGVRITHLVELLLYPSVALASQTEDFTVTMPAGEMLSSESRGPWVLSQHLKFPCARRMQRLYNAQIALSALHGAKGVNTMIEDVKAEDIVDGYREKTIALLWGVVGKWGLASLIDVAELKREIRRLRKQSKENGEVEGQSSDEDDGKIDTEQELLEEHTHLLKAWADAIGRKHGVVVYNFTTACSDGKIFHHIVDEYTQWHPQHRATSAPRGLSRKLQALGCSDYFGM